MMNIYLSIIGAAMLIYAPLALSLVYVWWKYGRKERAVYVAEGIFFVGSIIIFSYMILL